MRSPWWLRGVAAAALAYPLSLAALALVFRWVGERWWVTGTVLYLPRLAFGLPLPFLVALLAWQRQRALLGLQLLSAVLLAFPLMGLVLPALRSGRGDGTTLRVLSLNADGEQAGADVILASIDRYGADIVLLEEIVLAPGDPLFQGLAARYPSVTAASQFVVASRYPLSAFEEPDRIEFEGKRRAARFVHFVVESPLGPFALYEVHPISPREDFYSIRGRGFSHELLSGRFLAGAAAPVVQANSGLRAAQIETVARLASKETTPVLIVGDTNLPGLSPLLATLGQGRRDGFEQAGSGFGYTFPASRPWMRIDRMFASAGLRFVHFEVGCPGASDHLCIVADLQANRSANESQ